MDSAAADAMEIKTDDSNKNIEKNSQQFQRNDKNFRSFGPLNFRNDHKRKWIPKKMGPKNLDPSAGKKKKYSFGERLSEVDVGITEFVNNQEGFEGIIKDKYSDFQVREITRDNVVTKLTSFDLPTEVTKTINIEELKASLPLSTQKQLQTFIDENDDSAVLEIDVTEMDKATRLTIHNISKTIPNAISSTKDIDKKKMLIVTKKKGGNRAIHGDTRINWTQQGEYCYFVLHKVNLDTMDALNQLAKQLRIKPNVLCYAGTKDRRAKTSQWVCLKRTHPRTLERAGRAIRGIYIGNFKFAQEPLRLGMLWGNEFTITLRNVAAAEEHINSVMESLRDNGFINYYGLQRFGSIASIPTHQIGKALLQGDWIEAMDLILKPRDAENDENLAEARKIFKETNDASAALKKIERSDKIEAKLLHGIVTCGKNNPQGAFDHIPRNIRLMYIHSYQSFVWNRVVSRRLKEFGMKPIVGDLVFENLERSENDEPEDFNDEESTEVDNQENSNKCESEANDAKSTSENLPGEKANAEVDLNGLEKVKILTEEDLPKYKLSDVVIPLPGWKVVYPTYAESWFKDYLHEDGLSKDLKQKNRKYALGGFYRKILQIPFDLSWKTLRYQNLNDELVLSDIDEMRKVASPESDPGGKYKALIIKMSLKSSSYATMALREILKCDTSPQTQAAQSAVYTDQHEKTEAQK